MAKIELNFCRFFFINSRTKDLTFNCLMPLSANDNCNNFTECSFSSKHRNQISRMLFFLSTEAIHFVCLRKMIYIIICLKVFINADSICFSRPRTPSLPLNHKIPRAVCQLHSAPLVIWVFINPYIQEKIGRITIIIRGQIILTLVAQGSSKE